jgi:hypothetical protein
MQYRAEEWNAKPPAIEPNGSVGVRPHLRTATTVAMMPARM